MKKNLGNTPVLAPLPVLIVATYDEQGMPNAMMWHGAVSAVIITLH